ncbi:MAG: hypothetical protein AAGF76_11420, partial [Pseudomonadota bacterium]
MGDRCLRAGIGDDGFDIPNPSPQAPITHGKGHTVITGVAWSGRGLVKEVHVTLDGGKNW